MGSTDSNVIGISGQGGVVLLNKQVLRIFFAVVGRAAAAVRTAEGKEKKKLQNGKRWPRHRPAPVARGTQGDELRCRHRPLSGHGGHSDREDVGTGGETTPHRQTPPDRLPSALPGEQQFLEPG